MINGTTINKVKDLPIEEVLKPYVRLSRKGAALTGLCPFHDEHTASFSVSPAKNLYHCFGCGRGGDAISFIMEKEKLSFMDAVEFIARRHNIQVEYTESHKSEEEAKEARHRESLLAVLESVQKFFTASLAAQSAESALAREYAYGRWPEEFCAVTGIGYAPADSNKLLEYSSSKGLDEKALLELGLLRRGEEGSVYCMFRERIMIPVRNRWGRVIAYTARYVGNNASAPKYINSPTSPVYEKGRTLFGIDRAGRWRDSLFFIIVEGAPDVLRLQSVGLENTVAALGTAWTDAQFEIIRKFTKSVCFIPDSDIPHGREYGSGFEAVMKNGTMAVRKGLTVTVRELPFSKAADGNEDKNDPDSYIHGKSDFTALKEKHFIVWLAEKRLLVADSMEKERSFVGEIAGLLQFVSDKFVYDDIITQLSRLHGRAKLWKDAVARARGEAKLHREAGTSRTEKQREVEQLRNYGLFIRDNCYYATGKDDEEPSRLSNFTMEPLFHIEDENNGRRIFRMRNNFNVCRVVELKESEMCSMNSFQQKVGSIGNFVWLSKIDKLNRVKEYLYSRTDTARLVRLMGWNGEFGFYAFGNGILQDGEFKPVNDLGIVRSTDGKAYYLPATSSIYAGNPEIFQFERLMVHNDTGGIKLYDYVSRLIQVFGENATVAFSYLLATLFRDVVFKRTRHFPILNLFGEKGTGKTTLATALQSFFFHGIDPPNLSVSTLPALNDRISQAVNTLTVFDEYKNDLDLRRIAYLKGLWGGGGQTKKNVGTDGMAAQTVVTTGVALCGQDKPTQDMALYTRVIFLSFSKTSFNQAEKKNYEDLVVVCNLGLTHLAIEILKHRELFEKNFSETYSITKREMAGKFEGEEVHDRIFGNWVIPLAAFRTLETVIDVPFSYSDLFNTAIKGIRNQNDLAQESSEVADFWNMIQGFQTSGKCIENAHYRIMHLTSFKPLGAATMTVYNTPRPILYLNMAAIASLFSSRSLNTTSNRSNWSTITSYLKSHSSFLGLKQERFQILLPSGLPDYIYENAGGVQVKKVKVNRPKALCFDYKMLQDTFGLDLETEVITDTNEPDDEENDENNPAANNSSKGKTPF